MQKRREGSEEELNKWRSIIEEHVSSGMSGSRYCREREIKSNQFFYWRKRLAIFKESKFKEVKAIPRIKLRKEELYEYEIAFPNEIRLKIREEFKEASLIRIIKVIGG